MTSKLFLLSPFTNTRVQLDDVDLSEDLSSFKLTIKEHVNIEPVAQELVYMGEVLEDDSQSLRTHGIQPNTTVLIMTRPQPQNTDSEPPVNTEKLYKSLESAIRNPLYKRALRRILKDPDALESLLASAPSIRRDPISMALLLDPDLLATISETVNFERIVSEHPSLALVAEQAISQASADAVVRQQILHDVDGEEGEEYEGVDPQMLASVQPGPSAGEASSSRAGQPSSSGQQISATDLAQALSFANMGIQQAGQVASNTDSGNAQPQGGTQVDEASLQQLRSMGIMDDNLSRRALMVSNGDVQAALNLIFEGTI